MITIQMGRIVSAVANEKLRASGITSPVGHGKYTAVMKLVIPIEFTGNGISRTACTGSGGITSLYNKIRDYPVEGRPIIIALTSQFHEIRTEEHTSELQSLMRLSYAVFCLNKK